MIATRPLRRPRIVIVGFGDVATRTVPLLAPRYRVLAMRRQIASGVSADTPRTTSVAPPGIAAGAIARSVTPASILREASSVASPVVRIPGDLDAKHTLARAAALAAGAFGTLYFAPPAPHGATDPRTRRWISAVAAVTARARVRRMRRAGVIVPDHVSPAWRMGRHRPLRVVYASTSGVYGDCGGAVVTETRTVAPSNARAVRRVDAERQWRETARRRGLRPDEGLRVLRHRLSILRIPGIYAADRLPVARLREGMPALRESDDVYTNHIQADDLAAIAVRALTHGRAQRLYHASDDSRLRMGDYFDKVADALHLPHPPRLARDEAVAMLSPTMWSFMQESRQLDNGRLHRELGVRLRFPDVDALLASLPPTAQAD